MIYKTSEGNFVISSHRCWIVGVYDSKRTANYAFRFRDDYLKKLWDSKCPEPITFEDLQQLRKTL